MVRRRKATMGSRSSAAAALVALFLAATAAFASQDKKERGRLLYSNYCISCHGVSATGDGPVAEFLRPAPADLTGLSNKYGLIPAREKLIQFIDGRLKVGAHGPREMPVWGERFSWEPGSGQADIRETIDAIVEYLISIQKVQGASL
jgi:mono/diheme cytochrome c family protein